jgi:hypothetical protein
MDMSILLTYRRHWQVGLYFMVPFLSSGYARDIGSRICGETRRLGSKPLVHCVDALVVDGGINIHM